MNKIKEVKNMYRKGISPLIGTVLLIGFTIGLAMLIFTWGGSFVKDITEETGKTASSQLDCLNNIKLAITGASFDTAAKTVTFSVNNNGNNGITEFTARYTTDVGIDTEKVSLIIGPFGAGSHTSKVLVGSLVSKVELLSPTTADGVECTEIREDTTTISIV